MGILTDAVSTLVSSSLKAALPHDPILGGVVAIVGIDVLRKLIGATDAQAEMLSTLDGKVDRLLSGPWQTARLYLADTSLPDRTEAQLRDDLEHARAALFAAIPLQPERTWARAAVHIDLCLVSAALGDRAGAMSAARSALENGSPGLLLAVAQRSLRADASDDVDDLVEMADTLVLLLDACRSADPGYRPEIPLCYPRVVRATPDGTRLHVHVWWPPSGAERVAGILADAVADDHRKAQQRSNVRDGTVGDALVWAVSREAYGSAAPEGWYDVFIIDPIVVVSPIGRQTVLGSAEPSTSVSGVSRPASSPTWLSRLDIGKVKQLWDPTTIREWTSRPAAEWNPFRDRADESIVAALAAIAEVQLPHVRHGFVDHSVVPCAADVEESARAVLVRDVRV